MGSDTRQDKGNVLVTGGAGYIGSHTCQALQQAGYTPVSYDNLSNGFKEAVQWGPLEIGDILDKERLSEVLNRYKPMAVLHFAALISVSESVEKPELYYRNNVTGTQLLLDCMAEQGINKFVFSSSCAVHGEPASMPIHETDLCHPTHPYGQSKWEGEQLIASAAANRGLHAVILRYFNAAGADMQWKIGTRHQPETHLIPLAVEASLNGTEFSLYGTDYTTSDGTAVRDYIHVKDLAHAHVLALGYVSTQPGLEIFNLGTGTGTSVREVVAAVERKAKKPLNLKLSARRAGDPPELVAATEKARKIMGFTASYSQIDTIVGTTWDWYEWQIAHNPSLKRNKA